VHSERTTTEAIVSRDFVGALLQLNAEKQVPREQLIRTVEEAIQSAYRRVAGDEDIHVAIDAETGKIRVYRARHVVTEIEDELTELTIDDAKVIDPDAKLGDLVETEQLDGDVFGRIGAQTAKQVVLQRLREAERDVVFDQFASREGELITGTVNRVEPRAIILDVGKGVEAILATTEQSALEHYRIGQNVKAYALEVRRSTKGPQIFVSRTHKGFLKRLFELEVPEIHNGTVEIKAIAREAGSRSKVAVASRQDGLDPVGATVGQRGARVQAVVAELSGEKIDVIPWNDDPGLFVANALSPAQVLSVDIDEEHRIASVTVPERMLSLAIGREGQNARLAARLTGWRIDIRSDVSVAEAKAAAETEQAEAALAAAEAEVAAETPAKPKRASRAKTAAVDPATNGADGTAPAAAEAEVAAETPAKPKRASRAKTAAVDPATNGADGTCRRRSRGRGRDTGQAEARLARQGRRRTGGRRCVDNRRDPRRGDARHRGGIVVGRPAAAGPVRRVPTGPASPAGLSGRNETCCASSARRTEPSGSTRLAGLPGAAHTCAAATPASTGRSPAERSGERFRPGCRTMCALRSPASAPPSPQTTKPT
jgi:N utilization substance protein A